MVLFFCGMFVLKVINLEAHAAHYLMVNAIILTQIWLILLMMILLILIIILLIIILLILLIIIATTAIFTVITSTMILKKILRNNNHSDNDVIHGLTSIIRLAHVRNIYLLP